MEDPPLAPRISVRRPATTPIVRAVWLGVSGFAMMAVSMVDPILTPWVIGAVFVLAASWTLLPERETPARDGEGEGEGEGDDRPLRR